MAEIRKLVFNPDAAEEYFSMLLTSYRDTANDIFRRDNEGRHASEQHYSAEYQKYVGMQIAMREVLEYFGKFDLGGWISVKDRLPETDGIYIVCDRRLNGYPWIHTVGFRKVSSSWCELHGVYYDDGYGRYSDQDKFTHWMTLPEPPEEENYGTE